MKLKHCKEAFENWKRTVVLIIEEIGMLGKDLFDLLNELGKKLRKSDKPFGGIQIIACGDFLQLPPIDSEFCFKSENWKTVFPNIVYMRDIFRQTDPRFLEILSELRRGIICKSNEEFLIKHTQPALFPDEDQEVTKIYPRKEDVLVENMTQLSKLPDKEHVYKAKDIGNTNDSDWFFKNLISPEILSLKKDCKVMLIKNIDLDLGLANGLVGRVVKFDPNPVVRFSNGIITSIGPVDWKYEVAGKVCAVRKQIPLILAWAISIHKAQGLTLHPLEVDLKKIFGSGMAYVAISRAPSLHSLVIKNFNKSKLSASPEALTFYKDLTYPFTQ